jgi:5'(3')-deoxyribonucleotidase
MGLTIGVDVDLCVVNTDWEWWSWMITNYGPPTGAQDLRMLRKYNLTAYWPNEDPDKLMNFWRQEGLYDNLQPIQGSFRTLLDLSEDGHKIVFISSVKGNHNKSKYYFLKRHFPFMSGYIATKEKHFVDVDVMIDDRDTNLLPFKKGVKLIRYKTNYIQGVEPNPRIEIIDGWYKIWDSVNDFSILIGGNNVN